MPKVVPGAGQTVEETTRTRIVSNEETETAKLVGNPFDYMDSLSAQQWDEGEHLIYLYREEPPVFKTQIGYAYITKYGSKITPEQIQREYGGGIFRIVLKRKGERIADRKIALAGPPMDLTRVGTPEFQSGQPMAGQSSGDVSIAAKAMDIASNPMLMQAQLNAMSQAAQAAIGLVSSATPKTLSPLEMFDLLQRMQNQNQPKPFFQTEMGAVTLTIITALAQKLITPPDPLAQMAAMADLMGKLGSGSSASDWKTALVDAGPKMLNGAKDLLSEWRGIAEAQARLSSGRTLEVPPAAMPAPIVAVNPAELPNVVQMPQPAATGGTPLDEFEMKLIELLQDPNVTGAAAGEILERQWPQIVDEVSVMSVDQIVTLAFPRRPRLAPFASHPRVRTFLAEFLAWANAPDVPVMPLPAPAV